MTLTSTVLMLRPAAFAFSPEAAASNVFQKELAVDAAEIQRRALAEFDGAVATLRAAGVGVRVVEDTPTPPKPDAVFPNNWFSTHPDGTAVLYPMAVPSRRAERRRELVEALPGLRRIVDLSGLEAEGEYLEGTGSMVLDHDQRLAYACLSPRSTRRALGAFADATGYRPVVFEAELDGAAVYHTNVLMALGPDFVLLGLDSVRAGREALLAALAPRRILALDAARLRAFAGNALQLRPGLVMSRSAEASLDAGLREALGRRIVLDIPTIETIGGGSARCMLAELFFG